MNATYFGEPWGVPALDDAWQAPTPVGRPCIHCNDPIEPGDRGWLRPALLAERRASLVAIHAECELASILGHTAGICPCTGWPAGSRYTGLAVWAVVMRERGPEAMPVDTHGVVAAGGTHCADPGDTARIDARAVREARRPSWWRRLLRRRASGWSPRSETVDRYLRDRNA